MYRNIQSVWRYSTGHTIHSNWKVMETLSVIALYFHHPESLAADVLRDVVPVMVAPSDVLPGLWMGVEASQGRRWSEMTEVDVSGVQSHDEPALPAAGLPSPTAGVPAAQ